MTGRNRGRSGDKAVAYLAISFVLAAGAGFGCLMIAIFSPDPWQDFSILVAAVFGLLFLVWILRDGKESNSPAGIYRGLIGLRRKKRKVKIKIKRVKKPRTEQEPQGPPTVERIRELAAESNTWVPSQRPRRSDKNG